jgi:hypothetical protein
MKKLILLNFALVLAFSAVWTVPTKVSAFGISPPFFNVDKLTKGSRYESTIYLVQGQPEKDLEVSAIFEVPDKIKSWLSVDYGERFVIPKGTQQFPIKVLVQVPEDAELGIYQGYLRINTVPQKKEGEQIQISIGARVDINLKIGEGVFQEFSISKLEILDVEEGDNPKIEVVLNNTGNVSVAPTRATLDIFDKFGEIRLGFAQTEELPEVPSFSTKTFQVEFPVNIYLGVGEYWAETKIYNGETVIKELKTVFNVTENSFDFMDYLIYGGGGAVLLLAVFFLARHRYS